MQPTLLLLASLLAGHRALGTPPSPFPPHQEQSRPGLVVDATTGTPVEGALVETWTEAIDEVAPGLTKVGEARSDPQGRVRVVVARGALRAAKILVRYPGYLTYPGTLGDLDRIQLMPRTLAAPRVQVTDLEGRPIEGARITATQSCSHDAIPFEVRTGSDGIAVLDDFGVQDHLGELRVRANGYAMRPSLPGEEFVFTSRTVPIRLARQRKLWVVLLDAQHELLEHAILVVQDRGQDIVPRNPEEGLFLLDGPMDPRDIVLRVLGAGRDEPILMGPLPMRSWTESIRVGHWDTDCPTGTVRLHSTATSPLVVQLFPPGDWIVTATVPPGGTTELALPVGTRWVPMPKRNDDDPDLFSGQYVAVPVLAGGPFTGWRPLEEFAVPRTDEVAEVVLDPIAERRVRIRFDAENTDRLVVQVGEHSLELDPRSSPIDLSIPDGRLVALSEGTQTHRVVVDTAALGAEIDLSTKESLLQTDVPPAGPPLTRRVRVVGPSQAELGVRGSLGTRVERSGPRTFRLVSPHGAPVLLHAKAEGFADSWVAVGPEAGEVTVRLRAPED